VCVCVYFLAVSAKELLTHTHARARTHTEQI